MTEREKRLTRNVGALCYLVGVLADELGAILPPDRASRVRESVDLFVGSLEPLDTSARLN